jgi:DNA-binding transcriptional regulator YhcF (GntR family)
MNIELKDRSHGPVYAQVREQIESQIRSKTAVSGESLPTPASLATKLSVDKGEIQRAYFELEQMGLIKRETGKDFLGQPKTTYKVS